MWDCVYGISHKSLPHKDLRQNPLAPPALSPYATRVYIYCISFNNLITIVKSEWFEFSIPKFRNSHIIFDLFNSRLPAGIIIDSRIVFISFISIPIFWIVDCSQFDLQPYHFPIFHI